MNYLIEYENQTTGATTFVVRPDLAGLDYAHGCRREGEFLIYGHGGFVTATNARLAGQRIRKQRARA